jgi:peptide/nickel transport system substrate-binding protein
MRGSGRAARPPASMTLLLVVVLIAAACSGAQDAGDGGGATEPQGPQNLSVGAEDDAYETKGAEANVGQYPLNVNIFESLVRMDASYNLEPGLATKWSFEAPNTWTFTLRRGVTFHDGTPFDAKAVEYTFDRVAETGGGTPGLGADSTKIVDDYTVEITPIFENRRFVEQIVHPSYSIIAPGSNPGKEPIGTGPFKFVRYKRQEEIVVERNDDYWGDKARLEQITFRFLPEPNARRLALEAGEVDLILDVPREAVADLGAKGFVVARSEVGAYEALYQNISGDKGYTILQDPDVRHAIGYAIDREALVQGLLEGLASSEQTMIPSRLLEQENAANVEGYSYDPARAEQLLEQAGWTEGEDGVRVKDGEPLSLELINGFPTAADHGAVPEFLQDQLKRVGIEVRIVKMPDTPSYEERLASKEGDLWIEQGSQNDANPAFLPALLFWSKGLFGDIGYQPLFAPGGRLDELIVQALATPDSQRVKDLMGEAMHVLIDQEAIVIPLAGIFRIEVLTDGVQGYETHPSGLQIRYDEVFLTSG